MIGFHESHATIITVKKCNFLATNDKSLAYKQQDVTHNNINKYGRLFHFDLRC